MSDEMEGLPIEDLLQPISEEQPCGSDLRSTSEWDQIKEARRFSEDEGKVADWPLVKQRAASALRERTKDLRIAIFLTEACVKLDGFPGIRDSLRLLRELLVGFWDQGLYPLPEEDGHRVRAGPLEWLNEKLSDAVGELPLTMRSDGGRDYSYSDLVDARDIGSERSLVKSNGDLDEARKKRFDARIAAGHVSQDMFDAGVRATRRAAFEEFHERFQQAAAEYRALVEVMDQKLGEAAPAMSKSRGTLEEIAAALSIILKKKRIEEPDPREEVLASAADAAKIQTRLLQVPSMSTETNPNGWAEAEVLVRDGQVEQGLAAMARLAATETSGRNRFHRKLLLAEVCLSQDRDRLAQTILEELAEQIDQFHLDAWETPEVIGSVWSRLYRIYRKMEPDSNRTLELYKRLSRLDPWQALACPEA